MSAARDLMEGMQHSAVERDKQDFLAATHNMLLCFGLDYDAVSSDKCLKGSHSFTSRFSEGFISKLLSMQPNECATFSSYWTR